MNKVFAVVIAILSISACKKDSGISKTGFTLSLTANNTYDYDDIKVSFQSIEYSRSDSGTTWLSLPVTDTSSTGFINIHTILHGNSTQLSSAEISATHITAFRIKFDQAAYISRQGVPHSLIIPDDMVQNGVVIPVSFDIVNKKLTPLVITFNTNRSIIANSSNTSFTFNPDFRIFDASASGNIEGYLKPIDAIPSITVYKDSTSSSDASSRFNEVSIPYSNGYFKIVGIPAGKYNLRLDAQANGYKSQQSTNINVSNGITNNIGTVTLTN